MDLSVFSDDFDLDLEAVFLGFFSSSLSSFFDDVSLSAVVFFFTGFLPDLVSSLLSLEVSLLESDALLSDFLSSTLSVLSSLDFLEEADLPRPRVFLDLLSSDLSYEDLSSFDGMLYIW